MVLAFMISLEYPESIIALLPLNLFVTMAWVSDSVALLFSSIKEFNSLISVIKASIKPWVSSAVISLAKPWPAASLLALNSLPAFALIAFSTSSIVEFSSWAAYFAKICCSTVEVTSVLVFFSIFNSLASRFLFTNWLWVVKTSCSPCSSSFFLPSVEISNAPVFSFLSTYWANSG